MASPLTMFTMKTLTLLFFCTISLFLQAQNNSGTATKPKPTTPKPTTKTVVLSGTLSAPSGVSVTLQYNGANDLVVTPAKAKGIAYAAANFSFPKPITEGADYKIALKNIPSNMKGLIYKGQGKAAQDSAAVKIGIDYKYELLTRGSNDNIKSTFYESFSPAVGGYNGNEGRYVVFVAFTPGLEGASGKFRQIYFRDRNKNSTRLVSANAAGEHANGECAEPSISADGQLVVFESAATNLVEGDNNNAKDIFLWRAETGTIEVVTRSTSNGFADAESFDAAISGNGQFVVFSSSAANLTSIPKGQSTTNVFLRNLLTGKTALISLDPKLGTGGNGSKGSVSFDGNRVTFCSSSTTLVPGDNNNLWDIFLWQRGKTGLQRVSMTHDGKERNGGTESDSRQVCSALSGNGRFVAFVTTATNMVPGDDKNFQDVFVFDIETGKLSVASFTDKGTPSDGDSPIEQGARVALDYDGTWVAFSSNATNLGAPGSNIILHNVTTGKKQAASDVTGSYVGRPAISYSGGYVVFGKAAPLDNKFSSSGIFAHFTGNGWCRDCK